MSIISKTVRTVKTVKTVRVERTVTVKRTKGKRPQGVILYRGPSNIDGTPIVVVATGLARKSKNPKTGAGVAQTYILADNGADPVQAWKSGGDRAICGDCPHRGSSCYVNIVTAPLSVYRAVQRGTYPTFDPAQHAHLFAGRFVRLGSYGDPAAAPIDVWETVCGLAATHTGYTHQWQTCDPAFAWYCMASVETVQQRADAQAKGYRTFRVRLPEHPIEPGEFACPASAEEGHRLTCEECGACGGARPGTRQASPTIQFHGSSIAGNRTLRLYRQAVERIEAHEAARGLMALPLAN